MFTLQDGGFTVFGQVTPASFPVVEAIANLPVYDATNQLGSTFNQLPVQGTVPASGLTAGNLVVITNVTVTQCPACYCPCTLILTNRGEMPVEILAIGDTVVTASGEHRPIKWIGRRSYTDRYLAANSNVQPIRFRAGSLDDGLPRRDLLVSPEHAMLLDGVLVPARCLVNGSTITQERGLDRVDYFHVELDSHDVLLAEGAPSESFLDDNSRGVFHNAHEFATSYPEAPAPSGFCAPRVDSGPELDAIRRRLAGLSIRILAFSSVVHCRRRTGPVITSIRRYDSP